MMKLCQCFSWITTKHSSSEKVARNSRTARSGDKVLWPSYYRELVHLEKVNKNIWQRYQEALTLEGRKEFNIQMEPATEEQSEEGEGGDRRTNKGRGANSGGGTKKGGGAKRGGGAKKGGGTTKGGKNRSA